jgi:ribosomal protein S17E
MIKKIQKELTEKYQENFSVEIKAYTVEFYSENHLYIFNSKKQTLQKLF